MYKNEILTGMIDLFVKILKYNTADISIAIIKCVFEIYNSNVSYLLFANFCVNL